MSGLSRCRLPSSQPISFSSGMNGTNATKVTHGYAHLSTSCFTIIVQARFSERVDASGDRISLVRSALFRMRVANN